MTNEDSTFAEPFARPKRWLLLVALAWVVAGVAETNAGNSGVASPNRSGLWVDLHGLERTLLAYLVELVDFPAATAGRTGGFVRNRQHCLKHTA